MRQMIDPEEVAHSLVTIDLTDLGARVTGFWIEEDLLARLADA